MKEYVLALCCAAILVAILETIGIGKTGKLLTGLFLALVMISPLRDIHLAEHWQAPEEFYQEGQSIAASAQADSRRSICDIIISRTRTYILDEAESLGAQVTVEAIALDEATLAPVRVELSGQLSPSTRSRLLDSLTQTLGIGKEGIVWNG